MDLTGIGGMRLHIRFKIEDPERAVLNFHENYKVKKISLGGMLIESRQELDIDATFPMEITFADDKSIKFVGRIASCLQGANAKRIYYDTGVEFLYISQRNKRILREFIGLFDGTDHFNEL